MRKAEIKNSKSDIYLLQLSMQLLQLVLPYIQKFGRFDTKVILYLSNLNGIGFFLSWLLFL